MVLDVEELLRTAAYRKINMDRLVNWLRPKPPAYR